VARTRSFKDLVEHNVKTDKKFAEALPREAIDAMLSGDLDIGKAIMRDYIRRPSASRSSARRPARRPRA